jgi:Putative Flp pilus-assembly TadE/G-like
MTKQCIANSSHRKSERGSVLAYTVLSALFLFFAVGLGVDLSHLYLAKTELQNTADAAALAGASALNDPANPVPTAVDRALNVMNLNKYNFNNKNYVAVMSLADQRALVRFAVNLSDFDGGGTGMSEADAIGNDPAVRFIKVFTPDVPINIFFSIPILGLTRDLNASAVAGLSVPGNLSTCIAPLSAVTCPPGVTNCSLCDKDDPLYPNCTASKYWGKCPGADPYAIQTYTKPDPAGGPDITTTCDPKREFCEKCTYNIRSGPQNGQGPAAGNFQVLQCAGPGANAVKQALAAYGTNCACGRVSADDEVTTQTGDLAGAVRDGLNVRFDEYGGGLRYGPTTLPDTNIAQGAPHGTGNNQYWDGINYAQYEANGGTPADGSPAVEPVLPRPSHRDPMLANRRVLVVPIISIDKFTDETGNQTVQISKLGGFFMRSQVSDGTGGDIQVEYIADKIVGVIGYDPNDTNITNIVTPVLYR